MKVNLRGECLRLFPPSFRPWEKVKSDRAIAVLMSGGVDSSVTALLLKQAGWDVLGITMKIPTAQACSHPRPCCGADAALVCHRLDIPHYFLDVEQAFSELIITPFRQLYLKGITPNPCVDCNTLLKFGLVWDVLRKTFGILHMATGHYARIIQLKSRTYLARAADKAKDQSYFLYGIPRARLPYFHLPLGELSKQTVRELARKIGLLVAEKQESMELCFAGEGEYRQALPTPETDSRGPVLDMAGRIIAYHDGISGYTIGQRRRLGVAAGKPLYVTRICSGDNSITVGTRGEASRRQVSAGEVNTLIPQRLVPGKRLLGKIRSYGEPSACMLLKIDASRITVEFEQPQFAPSPGQRLVIYDKMGNVAAGGTII
jgi:tRNA-specific 2-thiouridylase